MKLALLIGCVISLAACSNSEPERIVVKPEIPADLLKPEPKPACQIETLKAAGICIVDYHQALGRANGKLVAIGEINDA